MSLSIDVLALILLGLITIVIIYFRRFLTANQTTLTTQEDANLFIGQHKLDPVNMELPLTGLTDNTFLASGGAFLPVELNSLLLSRLATPAQETESVRLESIMFDRPAPDVPFGLLRLLWAIYAFVILLGLIFLLIWMLSV